MQLGLQDQLLTSEDNGTDSNMELYVDFNRKVKYIFTDFSRANMQRRGITILAEQLYFIAIPHLIRVKVCLA